MCKFLGLLSGLFFFAGILLLSAAHKDPNLISSLIQELETEVDFIIQTFPLQHAELLHRSCSEGGYAIRSVCADIGKTCDILEPAKTCARAIVSLVSEIVACRDGFVDSSFNCDHLSHIFD